MQSPEVDHEVAARSLLTTLTRIHRREISLDDAFSSLVQILDAYREACELPKDAAGYVTAGEQLGEVAFPTDWLSERHRDLRDFFVGEEERRSQARGLLMFMVRLPDRGSPEQIAGGKGLARYIKESRLDDWEVLE
jgi:hypothetical protein